MAERFCCLRCRLLQEPGTPCMECASPLIGSLANERDLLKYRNADDAIGIPRGSGWKAAAQAVGFVAAYAGLTAGALVWWPIVPIVLGSSAGVGGTIAYLRRTGPIAGVPPWPPKVANGAVARTGVARKLAETLTAIDGSAVLVEEAAVTGRGGVLVRQVRAVPFLVELEAGERLVVTGLMRVAGAQPVAALARRDPRLASFGVPDSVAVTGQLEVATVRDGDPVRVTGEIGSEVIAELAFHRDGGEAAVMRGATGAVVAIARA